ncbi:MAG TPA: phosphoribosylanthranilate isomerase [Fulvivirga sp.]|nr:phosphoribosylanthranilate isomerase [Fulvivirga sp.]
MSDLNTIKLKVCGLRDNVMEVAALCPDFMGFIFYDKSPRYVGDAFVLGAKTTALRIGVFVDQPIDEVLEIHKKYKLDMVQLHGSESIDYCVELKAYDIKIIKVFAGNELPSQPIIDAYAPFIDYYLFDSKGKYEGGNGIAFDWTVLDQVKLTKPLFLSGGIDLDNVQNIKNLRGVEIYAIDVNSKFELTPGNKDIDKLKKLKSILKS